MKPDVKTVAAVLSELGVVLPVELLARLDIEEYLDRLDSVLALLPGERQRLGDLLRAAGHITATQLEQALAERRREHRALGEILADKAALTPHEKDVVLEFSLRQSTVRPESGRHALGNLLVARGEITRGQLEAALRRQIETGRMIGEELIAAGHASRQQVDSGLTVQRRLAAYALAVAVGLAPLAAMPSLVQAAQTGATMAVSMVVLGEATLNTGVAATQVVITQSDVARGYIEVPSAMRFSVTTISPAGYVMRFQPLGPLFDSVEVSGIGAPVHLGAAGGSIVRSGMLAQNQLQELSFRFGIRTDAAPGTYPWPLQMAVSVLH